MRTIKSETITETVRELFLKANFKLPDDVLNKIEAFRQSESGLARTALADILDNQQEAIKSNMPVCQDTGMAVLFIELGQDVRIEGAFLKDAVNEGVRRAYADGFMRMSVVTDPLQRNNTGDNTPAVIHTEIVPGDRIHITAAPKGFGSENMSAVRMFNPTAAPGDIAGFVRDVVRKAGSKPCPPVVIGVGIGGDFEYAAVMAKKALTMPIGHCPEKKHYRELQKMILSEVNGTGIGPSGYGGENTALGVNIMSYPTHIAGLPVAVNIGCHVNRHSEATL